MKHMSIRLSDDHAAQIEATGNDPSETIQAALNLYFQQDRSRTREEALMLISAAISAHEAQHHNKPFPNVPYRVTVKKSESPNFVANNEAQRDTKDAETCKVKAPTLGPEVVKRALVFILSELEADREPTTEQVSKALGIDSRQLGKALSKLGIKSKSIHRGGKSVKIYPLASKARVWELAALDTEGLQEMSAGRARATEKEMEHDREHFTVFD
jgi:predicted pyridoxine 5'-phosphate oxidase superfamily flavin-nucleotide-binding protein